MSKFKIKGITTSKDAPAKQVATTRLSKYMKKGSKMMKAPIKKSGDCGCGGGKIKFQQGGRAIASIPVSNPPITAPLKYTRTPLTAANNPYNSHRPTDPYKDTNLSVGGGKPPVKLALPGRAFQGYKQGITRNGVPSINYRGIGVDRYGNQSNRNVLGKYLGVANPGVKEIIINGKRVMIRQ